MSSKVMLVDDDETIITTLEYNLARNGYNTVSCQSGRQALFQVAQVGPDLIILDWMLGDLSGPEVCRLIRQRQIEVPILMLTGRAGPAEVAAGLESGADDYLVKPFSTVELLARVQALLRRNRRERKTAQLRHGELILDEEARTVRSRGREIDLSPKEFMLLRVLMQHAGKTLSTESLLNEVWGADYVGDMKTVAVHMRWLRKKLEDDPKHPKLLRTVHRSGYRLGEG